MKPLSLEVNGKPVQGFVENLNGVLWVHLNGRLYTYEPPARAMGRKGGKGSAQKHGDDILAPMPGKVIKVIAATGSQVEPGQVLVILEAMKMEYTLKAHAKAVVEKVACKAGDQVSLGQRLVHLKSLS